MTKSGRLFGRLSRREREITVAVFRLNRATVEEVRASLSDAPTESSVRATMNILVRKGVLVSRYDGPRKVYTPTVVKEKAGSEAFREMIRTYFNGSASLAVASLLDSARAELTETEWQGIVRKIEEARKEGR
jgi:BlaI family transcriptional regulator, penicillinase repressor